METLCREPQQAAEWEFRSSWVAVIIWELDGGIDGDDLSLEVTGFATQSHLTGWLWSRPSQIPVTLPNLEGRRTETHSPLNSQGRCACNHLEDKCGSSTMAPPRMMLTAKVIESHTGLREEGWE